MATHSSTAAAKLGLVADSDDPGLSDALWAMHLCSVGRIEEALGAVGQALKRNPGHFLLHIALGHTLIGARRFTEALEAFDRCSRIEPENVNHYFGRAHALIMMGRVNEAVSNYEKVLDIVEKKAPKHAQSALRIVLYSLSWLPNFDFGASNKRKYNDDMGTPDDLNQRARDLGLSFEQADKALERAAAEAARETTARAAAKPRPKWEHRKGADVDLSPPEFIAKHYAAEMAAGTLHRGLIGQEDKPLAVKLANWLRTHPMPENVDIPTLPEWNTRQLAKLEDREFERHARLYEVVKTRRRKLVEPAAA
jgi:tetratricopeptide (TPR) repeat protein